MKRFLATVFAVALGAAVTATSAVGAAESIKEKTKDTAETVKEKTKDAAETVKEKTKDAAESVKDKTRELKDRVTGKKDDVKNRTMGGNDDVVTVQQALRDKGHDPGTIDGKMGPRTRAALKDYQKAEGLKTTGRLDSETRARLGVTTRTSRMERAISPSASPGTAPTTTAPERGDIDKSSASQPTRPPEQATQEKQKPGA
jgi:peptidoglycan hydrolase-like protein with peptidoglycan-binding domain